MPVNADCIQKGESTLEVRTHQALCHYHCFLSKQLLLEGFFNTNKKGMCDKKSNFDCRSFSKSNMIKTGILKVCLLQHVHITYG